MTLCLNVDFNKGLLFGSALCFVSSFGFLINDLWDRDVDYFNNSGRFENSNLETISFAVFMAVGLLFLGLKVGLEVHEGSWIFFLIITSGLVVYSFLVRRFLLLSNLLAAFLGISPLWGPILIFQNFEVFYILTIFAMYLLFISREIFLDLKDMRGDKIGGRNTVATIFGTKITSFVALLLIISGGIVETLAIIRNTLEPTQNNIRFILFLITLAIGLMFFVPAFRILKLGPNKKNFQIFILLSGISMSFVPLLLLLYRFYR